MEENNELESLMPQMNVSLPNQQSQLEEKVLIPDDIWLGWCSEAMNNIRQDREEVDEYKNNFADMIINGGDATTSTKEAFVNLVKIKTDLTDKFAKILDLATRVKLKEKDTFPRYLAAHQNNTITIDGNKRDFIKEIEKIKKKKEKNDGQNKS